MPLIETWTYGLNTPPTDQSTLLQLARSFLFQRSAFLQSLGAGAWTPIASSNGTSTSGGGWASLSDLNWASSGAHSWEVLKSPAGIVAGPDGTGTGDQSRLWLLTDLNSANVYQATFKVFRVAPTGGTTSAAPTATDVLSYASVQFLRSTLSATAKFHFWGVAKGAFKALAGYPGTGYVPHAHTILPINSVSTRPPPPQSNGKPYPYAAPFFAGWLDSGIGVLGNVYGAILGPNALACFNADGTAGTCALNAMGSLYYAGSMPAEAAFASGGDYFTGLQPSEDLYAYCVTAGKAARMGWVSDIQATIAPVAQNTTDIATPTTKIFVGKLFVPNNGVTLVI